MAPQSRSCVCKFLFTFLICCACLSFFTFLNAQANNQPPGKHVTLKAQNVPIYDVFKAIFKQTSFKVSYANSLFNDKKKVSVDFSNTPLAEVMDFLLKGSDMEWRMDEQAIILSKKEAETPVKNLSDSTITTTTITGKITDAQGNAIPGATVVVKGTKNGVVTSGDGMFILPNVKVNSLIVVTSVGYETREIKVKGNSILAQLNVKVSDLDETVVIGYGTTTKRYSTSNISTVKAQEIEKQPVNNPLLALQGRVPGLFITQTNGLPGTGVRVRIQGQNSFANGSDPLYIIDGVPYTSQLLRSVNAELLGSSGVAGIAGSPFSFINPADIESIDILKDADATTIYGARAASGVILITTKKGKAGSTRINVNFQNGWGTVGNRLQMMNSMQYLEMRREALKNDGINLNLPPYNAPFFQSSMFPDLTLWDTTRYTDWQKALIGNKAQYTDVQVNISGGNATTQFLIGAGYHRETTVFPGDFADRKGSTHFNLNHASNNQKFQLQLSGNYLIDDNRLPNVDFTFAAVRLAPVAPPLFNADGSLNWMPGPTGTSTFYNPLANLYQRYNSRTTNLISNFLLSYQLLSGLEIKCSFGYTNLSSKEIVPVQLLSTAPENRPYTTRITDFGYNNINSWNLEPQLTLKRGWGKSKIEMLLGATIQQNNSTGQHINASGYISDLLMEDIKSAATWTATLSNISTYKYNGMFSRVNYNWHDKYILNLTARRDGSSRFGIANRFQNFGAVGLAWLFSNEAWMKHKFPIISFGKFRASYGTAGSDQVSDYRFLSLYSTIPDVTPYQAAGGVAPNGLTNPYLQWEETRKLQFGLDFGLLRDRILLTVNYALNRSSNQLIYYPLPSITGFESIDLNFPATIQNTGLELSLNIINIQGGSFNWSSNLNLTIPRNKLVMFPNIEKSPYFRNTIGQSVSTLRIFQFLGVNETTGLYQFTDNKGNPTYTPSLGKDATVFINPDPKFYGGYQNSLNYKGWQLDFLLQFIKQRARGYSLGAVPGMFQGGMGNQPVSVLDRWQQAGDKALAQRYNSNGSERISFINAQQSNAVWEDGSYVRLKNLSLSWQLPECWKKKAHVQSCRLYIQGQNLFTITKFTGLDPENKSTDATLPPLRVITTGVQLTL